MSETFIHIHAPRPTAKELQRTVCLDCKQPTIMIQFFTPWYGWDITCVRCGRNWQDGEWMALDFVRQSRQKSIESARQRWRMTPPRKENHYGIN